MKYIFLFAIIFYNTTLFAQDSKKIFEKFNFRTKGMRLTGVDVGLNSKVTFNKNDSLNINTKQFSISPSVAHTVIKSNDGKLKTTDVNFVIGLGVSNSNVNSNLTKQNNFVSSLKIMDNNKIYFRNRMYFNYKLGANMFTTRSITRNIDSSSNEFYLYKQGNNNAYFSAGVGIGFGRLERISTATNVIQMLRELKRKNIDMNVDKINLETVQNISNKIERLRSDNYFSNTRYTDEIAKTISKELLLDGDVVSSIFAYQIIHRHIVTPIFQRYKGFDIGINYTPTIGAGFNNSKSFMLGTPSALKYRYTAFDNYFHFNSTYHKPLSLSSQLFIGNDLFTAISKVNSYFSNKEYSSNTFLNGNTTYLGYALFLNAKSVYSAKLSFDYLHIKDLASFSPNNVYYLCNFSNQFQTLLSNNILFSLNHSIDYRPKTVVQEAAIENFVYFNFAYFIR